MSCLATHTKERAANFNGKAARKDFNFQSHVGKMGGPLSGTGESFGLKQEEMGRVGGGLGECFWSSCELADQYLTSGSVRWSKDDSSCWGWG